MPIVKLLRLCDGEKPVMGKIYDRMFMIGQRLQAGAELAGQAADGELQGEHREMGHGLRLRRERGGRLLHVSRGWTRVVRTRSEATRVGDRLSIGTRACHHIITHNHAHNHAPARKRVIT